jgi:hypothetical protein
LLGQVVGAHGCVSIDQLPCAQVATVVPVVAQLS